MDSSVRPSLYRAIAAMARVRRAEPGLRRGRQIVRLAEDRPGLFAFSRIGGPPETEYLVAVNTATAPRAAPVPVATFQTL